MTRRLLLPAFVLAGLLVVPAGASSATNPCREHAKKDRVLAQSPKAVVYSARRSRHGTYVNACSFKGKKSVRLEGQDGGYSNYIGGYQLKGRYLAFEVFDTEEASASGFSTVYSVNLNTRKTVVNIRSAEGHDGNPQGEGASVAHGVVLGVDGAVAWINENTNYDVKLSVHTAAPGGRHTVIDIGNDIGKDSLALAADRHTIYWTRAGQVKAATLP
jgi:hypothetical protein